MDPMNVDSLNQWRFALKYGQDHPKAIEEEVEDVYEAYKEFYVTYRRDHPGTATNCYEEFLQTLGKQVDNSSAAAYYKQHASTWSKAFTVDFRGPDDYVKELDRRLNQMASSANTTTYFNYVTIIQSSGYGKTRSILQLAHWRPLIYVCFRKDDSSGYPAATPQSKVMLADINRADSIDNAQSIATGWLQSMIRTFRAMQLDKNSADLLTDQDLATKFWNTVSEERTVAVKTEDSQRDVEGDIGTGYGKLRERMRIIIFFDEASALLDKSLNLGTRAEERKAAFRAIRRALLELRDDAFGILTDTNSAVSNLAPWKEHDPSARDYNRKVHQPFIYIATTDCFRESEKIPQERVSSGHDIVRFGRPLWGSYWESLEQSDETKFKDIGSLARFKLLGGSVNEWVEFKKTADNQLRRTASLAIVASIASLYVSPVSSEASYLVKSHMATLIAIDEERRRHLIKYPSEPVLSEAAMELLSEDGAEHDILTELDGAFQSGGIVNGGNQGELVMRLLLLSAWRRLVLSQREKMKSEASFSVRLPVLDFLAELIEGFPRQMFSHLKDFKVGFTHFIALTYQPDEATFMNVWSRRGAVVLKVNQEGSDLVVPIVCENNTTNRASKSKAKKLGVLVIQVKNYASQKQGAKKLLSDAGEKLCPEIMCDEDCANSIGNDYIGLFMHIGSVYTDRSPNTRTPLFQIGQYNAAMEEIVISKSYFDTTKTDSASGINNRFILLGGLNPFKLSEAKRNLFRSLLRTSNDPTRICKENEQEFLFRMTPCEYADHNKRRRTDVTKKPHKNRNKNPTKK